MKAVYHRQNAASGRECLSCVTDESWKVPHAPVTCTHLKLNPHQRLMSEPYWWWFQKHHQHRKHTSGLRSPWWQEFVEEYENTLTQKHTSGSRTETQRVWAACTSQLDLVNWRLRVCYCKIHIRYWLLGHQDNINLVVVVILIIMTILILFVA